NNISIDEVKKQGHEEMPKYGWAPVTVPGAPKAWADLSKKFGDLPFEELLQPAISYAENGFPVSPTLSRFWKKELVKNKKELHHSIFDEWFKVFAPDGRAPEPGEIWYSKDHAETLKEIAESKAESFYTGNLANKISEHSKNTGGFIRAEDLSAHNSEWVDPVSVNYRGYDVWEIPPNGQGIVALQALNILKGFEPSYKETTESYHNQIEAIKLAFADGLEHITEESEMRQEVKNLLSEEYGDLRRKLITEEALLPQHGDPRNSGTVYASTADKEGNMVSIIQSNYQSFGSGVVVPGTGI